MELPIGARFKFRDRLYTKISNCIAINDRGLEFWIRDDTRVEWINPATGLITDESANDVQPGNGLPFSTFIIVQPCALESIS